MTGRPGTVSMEGRYTTLRRQNIRSDAPQ